MMANDIKELKHYKQDCIKGTVATFNVDLRMNMHSYEKYPHIFPNYVECCK